MKRGEGPQGRLGQQRTGEPSVAASYRWLSLCENNPILDSRPCPQRSAESCQLMPSSARQLPGNEDWPGCLLASGHSQPDLP